MITRYPEYYKSFKCIADKCTDNCCIGWDIYIDDDKLELYKALKVKGGKTVASMADMTGGAHFKMKDGRCPFLDKLGLCEIISCHGEEALCEICAEHPRFYNRVEWLTECGIGASCPTAARLILEGDSALTQEADESSEPKAQDERLSVILEIRNIAFDIISTEADIHRGLKRLIQLGEAMEDADFDDDFTKDGIVSAWEQRCESETSMHSGKDTQARIYEYFSRLEYLNTASENAFEFLYKSHSGGLGEKAGEDISFGLRRIAEYFIYRYMTPTYYTAEFSAVMKLTALSTYIIESLTLNNMGMSLCHAFKEYSKQIEYNPDTIDLLFKDLYSLELFDGARLIALFEA